MARAALILEVKSELLALESTVRKIDEKAQLAAAGLVAERVGWKPELLGRVLVLPSTEAARRRVVRGAPGAVLGVAFPARGPAVRAWLRRPEGAIAGLLFVSIANRGSVIRSRGGPERVRRPISRLPERDGVASVKPIGPSRGRNAG
jgi:hypothetical protein